MKYERHPEANYELQINTWFVGTIRKVDEVIEIRAINLNALDPSTLSQIKAKHPNGNVDIPGFLLSIVPVDGDNALYNRLSLNVGKSIRFMYIKEESRSPLNKNLSLFISIKDEFIPEGDENAGIPGSYQYDEV